MNPLLELLEHGQSYWLDNLTRGKIRSGELRRRVEEEGLRGLTSNPAIFQKAISRGTEYDEDIERFVGEGASVSELYERVVVADIRDACDVLRPVYDSSGGEDGFVSLEVSPYLAHDTEASLDEARRLFRAVDRPNVFIKIPGTPAGVPAIEEALFEGININITLLFSIESYEAVAEAYIRALERRLEAGLPVDRPASVASFFLSRIDVLVDRLLGHRIRPDATAGEEPRAETLLGKAGIANAKLAYQRFQRIVEGERWKALERKGARVQRMLWASTSTKDPLYSDVRYVEPLIGPHTVNTMPDETIEAFAYHGRVDDTVEEDLEEARRVMDRLADVGIDFDFVTRQLQDEGVQKFIDPFDRLMATLAGRREEILGGCLAGQEVAAGSLPLEDALDSLDGRQFGRRLARKDPTLWARDPAAYSPFGRTRGEETASAIRERLGWLDAPDAFREKVEEIRSFAREVMEEGTAHVVLLGMGGSSLAAEVVRETFGAADGWPDLIVLDDTDPDAVRAVEAAVDLSRTLFLVASKSGTTVETLSFYRHFRERVRDAVGAGAGRRFAAITDPGTPLAEEARERGFRRVFENPADIGGRYSALSYFGLVPAALLGVDIAALLEKAAAMKGSCDPAVPAHANPGLELGTFLGLGGRAGRDKVTFLLSPSLRSFGAWAEQLLAESTGKEGRGLVPVVGEPGVPPGGHGAPERVGAEGPAPSPPAGDGRPAPETGPAAMGPDRLFVALRVADEEEGAVSAFLEERESEGHPVARITLDGLEELGAEWFRWEVAVAAAGAVMGIDPFDEPNVAESKSNTRELLEEWVERGSFAEAEPDARDERLAVHVPGARRGEGPAGPVAASPGELLGALLERAKEGDYVAILPYFHATPAREDALGDLRKRVAAATGLPTTVGHGPRYLHSTGQLHKGGPDRGIFLLLTATPEADIPIPGEAHGFATLQRAQALGDLRSLADRERRVARVHLRGDVRDALEHLASLLRSAPVREPAGGR